jgi:predicted phage-related endonuclease
MQRPTILPGSPEHSRLISPSKVPAICGISRWESQFTCWHRMKGLIDPKPPIDIFTVGLAFEPAMAYLWRAEHPGWRLSPGEVQYVTDEFGFPACATLDRRASRGRSRKVVEFKIAHHTDEWGDINLEGDCPADYALQVISQQVFSGLHADADMMVMGPFFKHYTYKVAFDEKVAAWMLAQCRDFWASLSGSTPPPLDDSVSTYAVVREMHPDIAPGLSVEIPEALAQDLHAAHTDAAQADRTLRGLKSKVLDAVGSAQYITANGQTVAVRQRASRGGVALVVKK